LEDIIDPLKVSIMIKSKENSVKQEKEKNEEIIASGIKTGMILQAAYYKAGVGKLAELVEKVFNDPESVVKVQVKAVRAEMSGVGDSVVAMDIS
jgi:hypothetical protein